MRNETSCTETVCKEIAHEAFADRTSLARFVLVVFLFVFVAARVLVYLIMTRRIPDLFLHVGGTHVHHLNYGIFLLSGVGAFLLFWRPRGRAQQVAAAAYGAGLALTFDEFGMWLHLGGPYWQRASFDAVTVIAALLGLLAAAPSLRRFTWRNWVAAALIVVVSGVFLAAWKDSLRLATRVVRLRLEEAEEASPP